MKSDETITNENSRTDQETKIEDPIKKSPLAELSEEEIKELQEIYEQRKIKFGSDKQKTGALNQPIYNFFQFIIGGPNTLDTTNEQQGKPTNPPYGP